MSQVRYRVLPRQRRVAVTARIGTRQRAQRYITPIYQQVPVAAGNPFAGAVAGGRAAGGAVYGNMYQGARANQRLQEHKTFDAGYATGGPITMTSVFASNAVVAPTPFAPLQASTGVGAWCLNQVPLGNSSITRVGRRFANTALALRARIQATTTTICTTVAMILVWDRNPNTPSVIPDWTAVLNTQSPISLTNKDNAPRFKILRRWEREIIGNNGTAGQQTDKSVCYIDEFIKLKNKVTLLTAADTTGLLTDMNEGALYLYAVGDQTVVSANAPSLILQTRLYFQDH